MMLLESAWKGVTMAMLSTLIGYFAIACGPAAVSKPILLA